MIEVDKLTKLYYSIGEVAEMFDVNTSLIRFWEEEFPTIHPKKNKKGNRLFSPKNIEEINKIYQLVKVEGYTLDGARKALKKGGKTDDFQQNNFNKEEIIQKLEAIKSKLLQLRNS